MFSRILIANRGEIAVRIIRACRDLGVESIAVYSEADKEALHAQIADEAVCIGPAQARGSYLNMDNLIEAALGAGAQAIHPGYGFLSENAEFAAKCEENGLAFIGPKAETIRMLGDKSSAKELAKRAGVPVTPGSEGILKDVLNAARWAEKIGYPVMIKASAGGGGKGIRVVECAEELEMAFQSASAEAEANFGDNRLYMEKLIRHPRHVEVQIMADSFGNVIHLYDRDCSVQRRHQKLIEEAPAPFLSERVRKKMCSCAVSLAKEAGYRGAGTVEFLVDDKQNFYFCEMNTRIQVEHPVTEMVTGMDLVAMQLRVAAGEPLSVKQKDVSLQGAAMECRINAEDKNFSPCPGTVASMHLAGGVGVRVDCAVYQGYTIPPYYDSMVGKLIVQGNTRAEALARMKRAMSEMLFEGVETSVDYQLSILLSKAFETGQYNTDSIENGDFFP
jgi:acetyl-CoA carboxylase biotin carboxylase subunit